MQRVARVCQPQLILVTVPSCGVMNSNGSDVLLRNIQIINPLVTKSLNTSSKINFRVGRSNRCRYMALPHFFPRRRPSAILNLSCTCSDHPRRAFGGLYHYAKFGCNLCSSFDSMCFSILRVRLETPIHAPSFWI